MTLDSLEKLADDDLRAVIARAETLLKQRDTDRKDKALNEVRATLAAVGLSLKDLGGKGRRLAKAPPYHSGYQYQHPTNKALTWNAKGKKPHWLSELESQGIKPLALPPQAANDTIPPSAKKTG